jgi:hypothetical protein
MRTRLGLVFAFCAILGGSCLAQRGGARPGAEDSSIQIAGVWRGHSVCEIKNSPCHDEDNVYRFSSLAGRPDAFSCTASKIVDGKEIVMGSGEWKYDAGEHVLESRAPMIRLKVDGDKMEGALTLQDGTVYRRIYLKKET